MQFLVFLQFFNEIILSKCVFLSNISRNHSQTLNFVDPTYPRMQQLITGINTKQQYKLPEKLLLGDFSHSIRYINSDFQQRAHQHAGIFACLIDFISVKTVFSGLWGMLSTWLNQKIFSPLQFHVLWKICSSEENILILKLLDWHEWLHVRCPINWNIKGIWSVFYSQATI